MKHLSNFWRTLDIRLIKCEINLSFTCSENCVLTDITTQAAVSAQQDDSATPEINAPTDATLK